MLLQFTFFMLDQWDWSHSRLGIDRRFKRSLNRAGTRVDTHAQRRSTILLFQCQSGDQEEPGIIPRAMKDVFAYIKRTPGREYLLRCSYLEIYNETIHDLLSYVFLPQFPRNLVPHLLWKTLSIIFPQVQIIGNGLFVKKSSLPSKG